MPHSCRQATHSGKRRGNCFLCRHASSQVRGTVTGTCASARDGATPLMVQEVRTHITKASDCASQQDRHERRRRDRRYGGWPPYPWSPEPLPERQTRHARCHRGPSSPASRGSTVQKRADQLTLGFEGVTSLKSPDLVRELVDRAVADASELADRRDSYRDNDGGNKRAGGTLTSRKVTIDDDRGPTGGRRGDPAVPMPKSPWAKRGSSPSA